MEIKFSITLPPELASLITSILNPGALKDITEVDCKPAKTAPSKAVQTTTAKPVAGATTEKKKPGRPATAKVVEQPLDDGLEDELLQSSMAAPELEEPSLEEPQDDTDGDFAEPVEETSADELVNAEEQKELKAALRAHSEKHKSREAAVKILMKYGKSSGEVKRKDLPALLKALKV